MPVTSTASSPRSCRCRRSRTWKDWGSVTDQLELQAGNNVIKIQRDAGDDGNVNIDYLDLGPQNERVQCSARCRRRRSTARRWTRAAGARSSTKTPTGSPSPTASCAINAQSAVTSPAGAVDAKNIVLQPAPTEGTWAADDPGVDDGTDDYLQAGLVAWTSATNYAKFVAMETPDGDWVLELGRRINGDMVYTNADLPDGAAPDDAAAADGLDRHRDPGPLVGRPGRHVDVDGRGLPEHRAGRPRRSASPPTTAPAARSARSTGSRWSTRGRRARHLRGHACRPGLPQPVRRHRGEHGGLEHGRTRPVHP